MYRRAIATAALLATATASGVRAQSSAGLASFADSIARLTDTAQVRQVIGGIEPSQDAPLEAHLRFGIGEMRVFGISDNEKARGRAKQAFDRARDIDRNSTWAHYGYAWVVARGRQFNERFVRFIPGYALFHSIGNVIGTDPKSEAMRSLRQALKIDPAFVPAVLELGRIALQSKAPDDVSVAANATRHAVGSGARSALIYAQLSELELLYGDAEAAANAARAGVALGSDGLSQRALGVALIALPREMDAGAEAYMSGMTAASFADSAVASAYYADVMPMLVQDEKDRWQGRNAAEKAAWLTDFWQRSAAKSARTTAERLQEHFTRVRYANANYQRVGTFGQNAGQAFRLEKDLSLPIDDRGILYIRLGKPLEVISTPAGDVTPPQNETWVYRRDGEFEMYHFHKYKGSPEWALGPLEACDPFFIKTGTSEIDRNRVSNTRQLPPATVSGNTGTQSRYMSYLQARGKYDARINTLAVKCEMALGDVDALLGTNRSSPMMAAASKRLFGADGKSGGSVDLLQIDAKEIARRDEETARRGMTADDARPRYEAPLQVITQLYAFRGNGDSTALMAAVLIPGQRFTPFLRNGVHVFPLALSVILLDSASGRVRNEQGHPAFRADQGIGESQYFRATLDMEAPPMASADYSIVVENVTAQGEGDIRSGKRAIPSFSGDTLMLSDLVVGEEGDGRWKRGSVTINPIPTHQVERDRTFKLFYEIYNMPASTPYRTSISVAPQPRSGITGAIKTLVLGKKSNLELMFDDVATSSEARTGVQQMRTISGDLDYGHYTITVTVQDLTTQRVAKRDTKLVVLSPKDLKQ